MNKKKCTVLNLSICSTQKWIQTVWLKLKVFINLIQFISYIYFHPRKRETRSTISHHLHILSSIFFFIKLKYWKRLCSRRTSNRENHNRQVRNKCSYLFVDVHLILFHCFFAISSRKKFVCVLMIKMNIIVNDLTPIT